MLTIQHNRLWRSREWDENNPEKHRQYKEKYYKKNRQEVIDRATKWNKNNPKNVKIINKKYYLKNSEKLNKQRIAYYEKNKKRVKKYYEKNRERFNERSKKYYKKNKEQSLAKSKAWFKKNPEKAKEIAKRYRQSVKGRLTFKTIKATRRTTKFKITSGKVKKAFEKTGGQCPYCPAKITETSFSLDHIHPISKGGTNHLNNLIACCKSCNSKKGIFSLKQFKQKVEVII